MSNIEKLRLLKKIISYVSEKLVSVSKCHITEKEAIYDIRNYLNNYNRKTYYQLEEELERLEILDKLVTDDCIAGNQVGLDIINNLIERANKYKEKAKQLEKENQELSQIMQLSNEYLAGVERVKTDLINENKKLKKALDILKKVFNLEIRSYIENDKIFYCIEWFNGSASMLVSGSYITNIPTQQEYELLKEVLNDDK